MKALLKFINPIFIIKKLFLIIKEIYLFSIYRKSILELERVGILKERGFYRNGIMFGLTYGVNLKAETLLYGGEGDDLKKFELSFIGKAIAKHNDIFINHNILELIKTRAERVKNLDYYGYIVHLDFAFKQVSTINIIWVISYLTFISILLIKYTPLIINMIP
jgi:hypothetical protein